MGRPWLSAPKQWYMKSSTSRSPVTMIAACQRAASTQRVLQIRISLNFREASECGSPACWATKAANWCSKSSATPAKARAASKLAGKIPPSKQPSTKRDKIRNVCVQRPSDPTTHDLDNNAFNTATTTSCTKSASEPWRPGGQRPRNSVACRDTKSKRRRTSSRKGFTLQPSAAPCFPNNRSKAASCSSVSAASRAVVSMRSPAVTDVISSWRSDSRDRQLRRNLVKENVAPTRPRPTTGRTRVS